MLESEFRNLVRRLGIHLRLNGIMYVRCYSHFGSRKKVIKYWNVISDKDEFIRTVNQFFKEKFREVEYKIEDRYAGHAVVIEEKTETRKAYLHMGSTGYAIFFQEVDAVGKRVTIWNMVDADNIGLWVHEIDHIGHVFHMDLEETVEHVRAKIIKGYLHDRENFLTVEDLLDQEEGWYVEWDA